MPEFLHADPENISRVIHSLLKSAFAYQDTGRLRCRLRTIGLADDPYSLEIEVSFLAVNIGADEIEQLLQPLNNTAIAGTRSRVRGQGLAVCQRIVELMGGQMEFSDTGNGRYSMRALIPVRAGQAESAVRWQFPARLQQP